MNRTKWYQNKLHLITVITFFKVFKIPVSFFCVYLIGAFIIEYTLLIAVFGVLLFIIIHL